MASLSANFSVSNLRWMTTFACDSMLCLYCCSIRSISMSLHAKITPLTKPMIRSPISHSWMYNVHIHLVRVQASHFSKCLNERAKPTQYVQHNLSQVCKVGSRRIQVRTSKLVSALTSIQNLAFSFVGYAAERMEFKSLVSEVLYRFKRCLKGQYELENVLISNRTITPLSRMVQMDVTGASNIPDILKELLKRIASASLHRSPMHLCRTHQSTQNPSIANCHLIPYIFEGNPFCQTLIRQSVSHCIPYFVANMAIRYHAIYIYVDLTTWNSNID
ncbi:unnamed protein product [Albugo candida]|uniref:Uncharacterized protein n=1 Tax=Albugo candida TaxID=65357 RepID=A0A024GRS3_9STRA|nr:unnamed protein product [Albugo candida]|eukprot:CCI49274.1 unnamed protein product [Albugo candida]